MIPHEGPVPGATAVGESGSMASGPGVRVSVRIDEDSCLGEIGFEVVDFEAARPVASAMCRALLGTTVDQASALSIPDLAALAGLPAGHPAVRTVHFAKSAALLPLLGRHSRFGPGITCTCFRVPTATIRAAIREHGLTTVDDVKLRTKAGTGCGTCRPDLERLLADGTRPDGGDGEPSAPA